MYAIIMIRKYLINVHHTRDHIIVFAFVYTTVNDFFLTFVASILS